MEMSRALQLQTHAEQIMEYTGNDFMATMTTIAKENEIKEQLGLSGPVEAPPEPPADPSTEPPSPSPQRDAETEELLLDDEDEPIRLRTDLSRQAAKR
jgi:hypothetical protein